jgi:hypothetical protein
LPEKTSKEMISTDNSEVISTDEVPNADCRNCGFHFQGKYCPECGQSVKDYDKPLRFLFVDAAGDLFAFDTRVWRTVKSVLFFPGKMEREYAEGKRVKYMPPFRFYVFVSFFFFLMLAWMTGKNIREGRQLIVHNQKVQGDTPDSQQPEYVLTLDQHNARRQEITDSVLDALSKQDIPVTAGIDLENKKIMNTNFKDIVANPELYFSRFIRYLSWSLFLLMPLYAGLLWLFFRKSRPLYMVHLNLAINHHVFIFLVIMTLTMIQWILPEKLWEHENYLGYLIPLYAVAGARNLFRKSWISTSWRILVIYLIYILIVALAITLLAIITFS